MELYWLSDCVLESQASKYSWVWVSPFTCYVWELETTWFNCDIASSNTLKMDDDFFSMTLQWYIRDECGKIINAWFELTSTKH